MIVYNITCVLVIVLCLGAKLTDGCTFPTDLQSGTWHSSDMGDFTFTSNQFVASTVAVFGSLTFTCQSNNGSKYFSVSNEFDFLNDKFVVGMCFNLYQQNTTKFVYYPLTSTLANTNMTRVNFQHNSYTFTESNTCTLSTEIPSQIRLLVKENTINESASNCNNNILGNFQYNVTGSSCNVSDTSLVACDDQTTLTFNYTSCADKMLYSAGGVLSCVFYASSGDFEYTIVYNQDATVDSSTYHRYTCIVSQNSGNTTYVSTYPSSCLETQNSTSVESPGVTFTMEANNTCAIYTSTTAATTTVTAAPLTASEDDTLSAGGAVAVALGLLVIIGAVCIIGVWYYIKVHRHKKIKPNDPDMIPAKSPPIDTKEQQKLDGRVSPHSPYPTVSELAVYRFGPSPADGIDDDDGGMTLEATTPGFTEGRRTIYDKDAERESQVSLPMYSEVGGETPEPTRLSEVNTRMSEVSEANIADPTPWTMTRATMNIPEESTVSPIQPDGEKVQSPREGADVTL